MEARAAVSCLEDERETPESSAREGGRNVGTSKEVLESGAVRGSDDERRGEGGEVVEREEGLG